MKKDMVHGDKNKGFTLAELLIVVAIIAVLVAVAIPVFTAQPEKSREAVDISNIRGAKAAAAAAFLSGIDGVGNELVWRDYSGGKFVYLAYDAASGRVMDVDYFDTNCEGYYFKGTAVKGGCEDFDLGDNPNDIPCGNDERYYTEESDCVDWGRAVFIYINDDGQMFMRIHDL